MKLTCRMLNVPGKNERSFFTFFCIICTVLDIWVCGLVLFADFRLVLVLATVFTFISILGQAL